MNCLPDFERNPQALIYFLHWHHQQQKKLCFFSCCPAMVGQKLEGNPFANQQLVFAHLMSFLLANWLRYIPSIHYSIAAAYFQDIHFAIQKVTFSVHSVSAHRFLQNPQLLWSFSFVLCLPYEIHRQSYQLSFFAHLVHLDCHLQLSII